METKSNEIKETLQRFPGTEKFHRIAMLKTRFTDGIQYMAEATDSFCHIS